MTKALTCASPVSPLVERSLARTATRNGQVRHEVTKVSVVVPWSSEGGNCVLRCERRGEVRHYLADLVVVESDSDATDGQWSWAAVLTEMLPEGGRAEGEVVRLELAPWSRKDPGRRTEAHDCTCAEHEAHGWCDHVEAAITLALAGALEPGRDGW